MYQTDDIAANVGEIHEFTGSDETLQMMGKWISNCCNGHEACRLVAQNAGYVPTRLVDVGTSQHPQLRLVARDQLPSGVCPQFTALSHCWGGDIKFKLKQANYRDMQQEIDITALPQNFQDAISVTRRLGLSYVWIDSLCIIQDFKPDWDRESPTMGQVYAAAHCVIAATASASSAGGCFRTRHRKIPTLMRGSGKSYIVGDKPLLQYLFDTQVDPAPLTQRAWAFQERLLSRRLVHFCSDSVLFECNTTRLSEYEPEAPSDYEKEQYEVLGGRIVSWFLTTTEFGGRSRAATHGIRGALDVLRELRVDDDAAKNDDLGGQAFEFNKRWYDLVSAYSRGGLTNPSDKLVALAGVADAVQRGSGLPYLAGLWRHRAAALGLLWVIWEPPSARQALYCAPSWSWASVNGRVSLLPQVQIDYNAYRKVIDIVADVFEAVVFYQNNPVTSTESLVDDGRLQIAAPIAKVRLLSGMGQGYILQLADHQDGARFRFFPDWVDGVIQEGGAVGVQISSHLQSSPVGDGELLAIRVMEVVGSAIVDSQVYGIVVREKPGAGVFERVGAFWKERVSRPTESSFSRDGWTQQIITIV